MREGYDTTFVADPELLLDLKDTAGILMERHLAASNKNPWIPESYVPYSFATDYNPNEPWNVHGWDIPQWLDDALTVNLSTEDNLPYYSPDLDKMFGGESEWDAWNKRWTAEERRHSIVLRSGIMALRLVDPVKLEAEAMIQVSTGEVPKLTTPLDGMIYVALQELATFISHNNTANALEGFANSVVSKNQHNALSMFVGGIKRTGKDENLHYLFYKDICAEAYRLRPLEFLQSLARVIRYFEMPGTGIPDFKEKSERIAAAGIYSAKIHVEKVLEPVIFRQWHVDSYSSPKAATPVESQELEKARENVMRQYKLIKRVAAIT
ncbi:acyl-ACP desaturase [bacterium]|nr:acyl-ACP desaturase [bacterium]NBX98613.1 acyl-ACP desaturase [bacterium]NDC94251.1 acyl-ACP desaturase [bacterium]NDD84593.1 acyl-ACP desaturase [bacterium]NDG29462.1 acyl-ACP desaturase [bacterium]